MRISDWSSDVCSSDLKVFDSNNSIFSRGGNAATRFTLGQFGLQGADVISRVGGGHDYLITPVIDAGLIDTFPADPANAAYFVLDETSTLAHATLGDPALGEDIAQGYAMENLDFGSITATPGIPLGKAQLK